MSCQARRQQDEMHCGLCGLQWEVGDEDRPECLTVIVRHAITAPVKALDETDEEFKGRVLDGLEAPRPHGRAPRVVGDKYIKNMREGLEDDD